MCIATKVTSNDTYMVRKSDSIVTDEYQAYGTYDKITRAAIDNVVNAPLKEANVNRLFEDFVEPLNLFDKDGIVATGYFNANGTIHASDTWNYEFCSVTAGASYSCTGGRSIIVFFDGNNAVVGYQYSGSDTTLLITAPNDAIYMGISTRIADNRTYMIRKSSTLIDGDYRSYGDSDIAPIKYNTIECYAGSGDSLRTIIDGISDNSYYNRYIIKLHEGTYNIANMYTSTEKEDENFIGLTVPAYVKLLGIGSRDSIILTYSLDDTNPKISTLNLEDTAELENLYIFGHNTRYVVHDDYHHTTRKLENRVIKNVKVVSDRTRLHRLWGAGLANGLVWSFIDCEFVYTYTHDADMGCFACHNNKYFTDSCYITIENCRFTSVQPYNVILQTMTTDANNLMCYCKVVGSNGGGIKMVEIDPVSSGAGCLWTATGYANTFDADDVEIITSDSQDYSAQNQII